MSSYGHTVRRMTIMGYAYYRLYWKVDFKYEGSRLRFPRGFSRDTDEAGARRFCKKWGIAFPESDAEA